jgi:hypothetical protein
MKADANANLMYLKARVNKVPGVTQRWTRFAICTINSHFVYPVNARSALVIWT